MANESDTVENLISRVLQTRLQVKIAINYQSGQT